MNSGHPLRLISWNLHLLPTATRLHERVEQVAERVLKPPHADFLLFQEVWLPGLARTLAERLDDVYMPVVLPTGWFPGGRGGLSSFVRRESGWQVTANSFEPFTTEGPSWRIWEGDGFADKGIERFEVRRDGEVIVLMNTHLQAQYGRRTYREVRQAQLAQLSRAAQREDPTVPLLAAGDLNTEPGDSLYAGLTSVWSDPTASFRRRCGCGTVPLEPHEVGVQKSPWIDYVLVRESPRWKVQIHNITLLESRAPDDPYSDHHGIELALTLEPRESAVLLLGMVGCRGLREPSTRRDWLSSAGCLALAAWMGGVRLPRILGR
ncbi:endonuclease/exonuclease/phosphatase family protein [Myxococcota bacterium]|nr:endonuclease/exonuclease/phosphatase family protein [Myxococcota bacterium]